MAEIQAKIDKLNKQVEKEPPPGHLLESTRLFLERAKKRLVNAAEEVADLLEGRLEQVLTDLARGSENPTPDMAKVQEL